MEMLEKPVLLFDRNTGHFARLRYSCPDFTGIFKAKFIVAAFVLENTNKRTATKINTQGKHIFY